MNVGKVQSVQINSVVFMLGVLGAHELFQINSHFCPVFCPLPLIFLPSNFAFSFALFHICPIFCPHFLPLPLPSTKKRARARAKNEGKIQGKCGRGQKRGQNQILLECLDFLISSKFSVSEEFVSFFRWSRYTTQYHAIPISNTTG